MNSTTFQCSVFERNSERISTSITSRSRLRVTRYDYLNAWLIAGIVIAAVLFLVLAALLMRPPIQKQWTTEGTLVDHGLIPVNTSLAQNDWVNPDETPDVVGHVVDAGLLSRVSDSVSSVRAGFGQGQGQSSGPSGMRGIYHREPPIPVSPAHASRWKISYELSDLASYAQQLRHFGVELGVVDQIQNDIWRIGDVGRTNIVVHSDRVMESSSTYFVPVDRAAKRFDRLLVAASTADYPNSLIVHFYPNSTLEMLGAAEGRALPAGKTVEHVKQTQFRLVRLGSEFEVRVERIQFK